MAKNVCYIRVLRFSESCLLQLISRNEDKLLATMTDEQKELFTRYADCVREYQVMAECLLFQNSFRQGGRMMLEVMRGGIGNE